MTIPTLNTFNSDQSLSIKMSRLRILRRVSKPSFEAAANGELDADEGRDEVAKQLSHATFKKAKKLAARDLEQYRLKE
ncbi:MAG: hypothetical protein ACRC1U_09825 [Vibrionaceae bacterium]